MACEKPRRRLFPFFTWWWCPKRKASSSDETRDDEDQLRVGSTGSKEFTYDELVQATDNFSSPAGTLGEGPAGDVYRGQLASEMAVSVERCRELGGGSTMEHINKNAEAKSLLGRLDHENPAKLIGWCHEPDRRLLVFEHLPHGTLHEHLFGDTGRTTMPWWARYKVAVGLASALCYLHDDLGDPALHKNINSHNVLLDEEFNMKLGGLAFGAGQTNHGVSSATTVAAAAADAQSYVAPELSEDLGESTTASDVYSFGVVALEIATGRDSSQYASTLGHGFLVRWVWRCYEYEILREAFDETLGSHFDGAEVKQLMVVGLWCTHSDPSQRPEMASVLRVLQFQEVPPIPAHPGGGHLDLGLDRSPPTPNLSRSPSVSSACDSDLEDCLR